MDLNFTKMHGLGNDFIVIDDREGELELAPEAVEWFCDRNFGIGADGLMLVRPATTGEADFSWWFRNSDGSVAEMCGNGIRCFAKYVVDHGLVSAESRSVRVETDLGVYEVEIRRSDDGLVESATVDMGAPILRPADIPTTLSCEDPEDPVINCDLNTSTGPVSVSCISMGNPHCIIFVDDVETAPVYELGSEIEIDPAFPRKTNVEFVQILGDDRMRLRVWERGVGETLACGTGACAATVATALSCRGGRDATVELPGGELVIRWSEDGHVLMTGPAEEVFAGVLRIPEDD
ncbi:MAG: diaminopimelate epimerase [Coriobacteriia bacterium]|nr:diaminopimelate epimerase [Coriobacteriia bacterium]